MRMGDCSRGSGGRLLCYWLTAATLLRLAGGEQSFVQQPADKTAKHGQSVTLPCQVADRVGTVQWTKDGFGLGTDPELQGFNRYTMQVNDSEGVYNLHIQPVLVEDDGVYQCQVGGATGSRHLKSTSAKLTVHFPPTDAPDQVYLDKSSPMETTAGAPIRITCEAGLSTPASEIKWLMNGKEGVSGGKVNTTKAPQQDSILVAVKSRLDVTPERSHHLANVTCQVSHAALDAPITRTLLLTVKYPPSVTIAVDSAKIKEFDDVRFECDAEGNPGELRYHWEVNGVAVVGDPGTTYLIRDVSRDLNGAKVACTAANVIGSTRAEHTLSVEYAPRFKTEPTSVDEDEGKEVTLTCDVDGNPPPEIVWLHEEEDKVINLGSKLKVKVTAATAGTYHCRAAVTGFKEASRSMRVVMRGAPRVVPLEEQFGLEGDTVQVKCEVEGLPRPSQVVWARPTHLINPNESQYSVLTERTTLGVRSTLVVLEATRDDFGTYNCTAKNGYGSHTGQIILQRQQSLPLVTTLVAIIGGIVFLVVVVVVVVLFKKKSRLYKEPGLEKQSSMRSSDRSSIHDSVLKVETRTVTGSDLSPSDEDDYSSHDDWDPGRADPTPHLRHPSYRYSGADYISGDPAYPLKDGPNNNSGAYVPTYVNYSSGYNPPPAPPPTHGGYNRTSVYSTATPLNNLDPRYSAAYGNPYLRVPSAASNTFGSSGGLDGAGTGGLYAGMGSPSNTSLNNNNINNNLNNSSLYAQLHRNNLHGGNSLNNQYIVAPDTTRLGVQGTHI